MIIEAKADLEKEVEYVQSLLQQNLVKATNVKIPHREPKGVLAEINETPITKVKDCFGDFGVYLKKFVEHFNFSHPCLQEIISFFDHTTISSRMSEVLGLYDTAIENEAHGILNLYRSYLNEENKVTQEISRIINIYPPLRAISDPGLRAKLRKHAKLSKNAGSVYFSEYESDPSRWQGFPDSMSHYVRLNDQTISEIEATRKRKMIDRFADLGMDSQANACRNYLNNLLSKKRSNYCGFQLVGLEPLMATLGKVHGFVSEGKFVYLSADHNQDLVKFLLDSICMSPRFINEMVKSGGETWQVQDPTTLSDAVNCLFSYVKLMPFFQNVAKKFAVFFHRTRVYMASNSIISRLLSDESHGIIDQLERFHDYGHLPLFDHFLLFVPSIKIIDLFYNEKNKGYFIHDGVTIRDFRNKEDASVFLDLLMIRRRFVYPFLVGQKDDQQYPIGYCV